VLYVYEKIQDYHDGNIEKENNGYVVFKWDIHGSAGKWGGGGEALLRPTTIRLLDRYLETM
jgi:hypothetical protein